MLDILYLEEVSAAISFVKTTNEKDKMSCRTFSRKPLVTFFVPFLTHLRKPYPETTIIEI